MNGKSMTDASIITSNAKSSSVSILTITQATTATFTEMYFRNTFLFFIANGTKEVVCPINGKLTGQPGDVMIFPPNSVVTMDNHPRLNDDYKATGVSFTKQLVQTVYHERKFVSQPDGIQIIEAIPDNPMSILALIEQTLNDTDLPASILQHRLLEPLVWLKSKGVALFHAHDESPLSRVRAVIESDIGHSWKSKEVSEELAMSEATLRRTLAKTGDRFSKILKNTRLEHGLSLLQSTTEPITEIALICGFKTPSHFSDAFKGRFGIKPSQIRFSEN